MELADGDAAIDDVRDKGEVVASFTDVDLPTGTDRLELAGILPKVNLDVAAPVTSRDRDRCWPTLGSGSATCRSRDIRPTCSAWSDALYDRQAIGFGCHLGGGGVRSRAGHGPDVAA